MRPQQVFGITALLPLLVALIALQLDEKPIVRREGDAGSEGGGGGGGALEEFVGNTRAQGGLLWETVAQRQVWLPALFIFLWQATTPSLPTAHCPLPTAYCLPPPLLPTACCSLLTTDCTLRTAHCSLLTTICLLTTYYSLPSTHCLLRIAYLPTSPCPSHHPLS